MSTNYTEAFYKRVQEGAERSAAEIVPLVLALTGARSVVDVGCGNGRWLEAFRDQGITDTLGLDGAWVDASLFRAGEFAPTDLTQPFTIGRQFDLAVCLEVGEHLPDGSSKGLVASLVQLAPVVLFSAAIPQQGGVDHVNEQWPEYWASLFAGHGYRAVDAIRPRVWTRPVESWYAQNTIVYVASHALDRYPELHAIAESTDPSRLAMVHPRHYLARLVAAESLYFRPDPNRFSLSTLISVMPTVVKNAVMHRLRGR